MIYVCDIMLQLKLDSVKDKILELIQCWAHAFKDNSDYRAVGDVYTALKNEGEWEQSRLIRYCHMKIIYKYKYDNSLISHIFHLDGSTHMLVATLQAHTSSGIWPNHCHSPVQGPNVSHVWFSCIFHLYCGFPLLHFTSSLYVCWLYYIMCQISSSFSILKAFP